MKKKRRIYEPRVFQGRVMEQKDFEQLHAEILTFDCIEAVTDEMRELIEDVWPELVHKLPLERNCQARRSALEPVDRQHTLIPNACDYAHSGGRESRTRARSYEGAHHRFLDSNSVHSQKFLPWIASLSTRGHTFRPHS
jgi:hypothetical protein